jgi:hypothetical protein
MSENSGNKGDSPSNPLPSTPYGPDRKPVEPKPSPTVDKPA